MRCRNLRRCFASIAVDLAAATIEPRQETAITSNHLQPVPPSDPKVARALWIAAAMTALIGAFLLLREHRGHVAGHWPYLLLLASR